MTACEDELREMKRSLRRLAKSRHYRERIATKPRQPGERAGDAY